MIAEVKDTQFLDLELHSLPQGGYVIREAVGMGLDFEGGRYRGLVVAFSTLEEALKWLGKNVARKEPTLK